MQDNIISAEKFLFDIKNIDNLIVGSSLSKRLETDSLTNFYNLSFNGLSIFDGLEILENKYRFPKNVFIEINVIVRDQNKNFNEIISSPILNVLKRQFMILRTDKQPLTYARNLLKKSSTNKDSNSENEISYEIFQKLLLLQKESYSEKIDSVDMNKKFQKLTYFVNLLESNGVKVIFFEMPVNPELVELRRASYLRNRIIKDFPDNNFIRLPDNINSYETEDGIHLKNSEAKMYSEYFKKKVANIN
ncbi:MAG: hypothetical protein CMO01_17060 [Thalassobius sp.]|nr:hypothetical protein [Thalassovita sp.]